jgi:hypothetical protein
MNAYELTHWKPRFEHLRAPAETVSVACTLGFLGYQSLCVKEFRDGEMQIKGAFQAGDTLLVRERSYQGWRYRLDGGPWTRAIASREHFLALPIPLKTKSVDLEFFPADFYFLAGACGLLSILLPACIFLFRKRR